MARTFEKHSATLKLTFSNGETIETTKEHPFYVESEGFRAAGELGIGTSIVTRAGPSVTLASTSRGEAQTVYNFEVEDFHTYFVGKSEVWVHNQCDLEGEARQHADHIRDTWPSSSKRPTTSAAIEIPPLPPFKGHNFKEGMDWPIDEDVADLYKNVRLEERNPYYHAKCAEVQALSAIFAHYKAQGLSGAQIKAMLRQNGGRSVAVQIGTASHGNKKDACDSCAAVLRALGLTF